MSTEPAAGHGDTTSAELTAAVRFITHNRIEAEDDIKFDPVRLRQQIGDHEFPF